MEIIIVVLVLAIAGGGALWGVRYSKRGVVTVQTGGAVRQDLVSLVTASGEVKPRKYINIGANAMGELTEILVKKATVWPRGQLLARVESVQPEKPR